MEYTSPWMPNPVFNQGIPDHRTYEQRILASSEAMLLVLEEIKDEMILLRGDVQHLYTAQTAGAPQPKPAKGRK